MADAKLHDFYHTKLRKLLQQLRCTNTVISGKKSNAN